MLSKKIKSTTAVLMSCFMLVCGTGFNAKAADIQPRLPVCGNCGNGYLVPTKTYGNWYYVTEYRCKHGFGHGNDRVYNRSVTTTQKCNSCGAGSSSTSTESKIVCYGSN